LFVYFTTSKFSKEPLLLGNLLSKKKKKFRIIFSGKLLDLMGKCFGLKVDCRFLLRFIFKNHSSFFTYYNKQENVLLVLISSGKKLENSSISSLCFAQNYF